MTISKEFSLGHDHLEDPVEFSSRDVISDSQSKALSAEAQLPHPAGIGQSLE